MSWPVRITEDVITEDTAGNVIASIPVRAAGEDETNTIGQPIDPIDTVLSDTGTPVRIVLTKTAEDSAGNMVDTVAVTGEAVA